MLIINDFKKDGFEIIPILDINDLSKLEKCLIEKIEGQFPKSGQINSLNKFHKLKIDSAIEKSVLSPFNRFIKLPQNISLKIKRNKNVRDALNFIQKKNSEPMIFLGSSHNENNKFKVNYGAFRLVKPHSAISGVHQDSIEIVENLSNNYISLWIPIKGFSSLETLNVYPKSHLYKHPHEEIINDNYLAKSYSKEYLKNFKSYRPNLKEGELIVFGPNLLHGRSYNLSKNTRCSLELRICDENVIPESLKEY